MNFSGSKEDIINMLGGNTIKFSVDTFQNDITTFASKDDVLALLVHLWYLAYDFDNREVFIPNHEIQEEFIIAVESSGWDEVVNT